MSAPSYLLRLSMAMLFGAAVARGQWLVAALALASMATGFVRVVIDHDMEF